jgi:S1-C subfamily serine protease
MPEISASTHTFLGPALGTLVSIQSYVPDNAMSAGMLGTERTGHGIRLREDGLIVTIGYVVTEAEEIWITSHDRRAVPGFVVGSDFESGLALIKTTIPLPGPIMEIGDPSILGVGDTACIAGSREANPQAVEVHVVAKQEFAGRWEYVLDKAIFTAPPYESWSGAALLDQEGRLCGVGSLVIQGFEVNETRRATNMFVPIDLLPPIIDEICEYGRRSTPPRPWLGLLVDDEDDGLIVVGVYRNCPADKAGLRPGDVIIRVGDQPVHSLANMFKTVWSLGAAGINVPLLVLRSSQLQEVVIKSTDRSEFLRKGTLQ